MKDFNVLTLGDQLSDEQLEMVIAAFAEMYRRVTFKHYRWMKLKIICSLERGEKILTLAKNYKVGQNVEMVRHADYMDEDWSPLNISVLFFPTHNRVGRITREALSQSIPVVSFENESISEYVDQSCSMLIRSRGYSQDVESFSRILNMLYFDPEVRKLLKKGASRKYMEISGFKPTAMAS